ncbi:MAG: amidohydrolase [Pseudomonadota bacterium]
MRARLIGSALALTLAACTPATQSAPPAADQVDTVEPATQTAAAELPVPETGADLITVYRYLHANPELSFKEAGSAALLAAELKALGFTVTEGVGDDWVKAKAERDQGEVRDGVGGYGVVGILENGPGPTVLVRADMDALPVVERTGVPFASTVRDITWTGVENGVMHACGHDVHMTSWLGTARALAGRTDDWSGTLVMILQPAEELGLGAQAMLEDRLFERFPKPDVNLALHVSASTPSGTVAYTPGFALANVDSVDITVKGVGGHGAYPHTTKDPVIVAAHIITALQTLVSRSVDPQTPAVVTVGSIKAGAKHNIVSDEATLLLTVRSYDDDTRKLLLDGIKRIADAQAAAFGAPPPDVVYEADAIASTYNDPELTEASMAAIAGVIGTDNVMEVSPVMGGEDFSAYSRTDDKIPSLIFWVGAVEPDLYARAQGGELPLPSLHSPFFAPDAAPTIETGHTAMTAAAINAFKRGAIN